MSTAILEGYGDLIIHDGNTDFTIVKPTPFATNSTKVKRWWRQNYNVVTYEACAIVELLDFYIVVSCAQDVQLKMTFDGTSAVTFDVGYDKPGDGNIERILVVPKTEFHNPINYDDYYYDYSTRELRKNSYGNGAIFDIFLSAALDLNFAVNKSLVDSISGNNLVSFTRASSGTFVGADGLIKTASTNEARFDHDPATGESLGLLIEEARTNILLKSEKLDAWFRGSNSSVTANQAVAPDGTTTADRVQHGSVGSSWLRQNVTTPGVTYTISIYAKAVTPGTNDQFTFELGFTSPIFTATGEWQRFTFTNTAFGTSVYLNNANDSFATDVYFWGAQVEEGSFATSYIPTDSSTVTRAADVAEITGTNFSSFYNQSAGTIFADNSYTGLDDFQFVLDYSDGTLNNRHSLFYLTTSNPITLRGRTRLSNDQSALEVAIPASGVFAKTAYAYASNDFAISSAGSSVLTDSTGSIPTINQLTVGATFANSSVYSGHIKRLVYFPTRLPDEKLKSITS